ncbi:tRNA (guanine-N7-)-methyltransferase [Fistulifera solaris]|uniref:tRNA (guanine-N(7)-)-methyltransferase n=1 Tax=Fistulifera solaris TaxID=1519565 RepID=A0A1Z5KFG8_FISSO|nr:tRNA (guanine-N7-)-methyltransferase [Fistulifera solaris]|eukprot:GAX25064.1 tRNA (guanine-N7-)-methyltransferase [Fistulifera solaris]
MSSEASSEDHDKRKLVITPEGERPQKKFYRQRAHCNPLSHNDSFAYPIRPDLMDWTIDHYPGLQGNVAPTVLDIGCGFGGLTMALGKILPPEARILGMEIRAKVTEYVRLRIVAARKEGPLYQNCSVLRTNSMKFLPNFFAAASLDKLFFCFPDPHFKRKNHPRRIVSERLLSEYAHVLKPTIGRLYCITDVEELHQWHVAKCDAHPLFRRLTVKEEANDPCIEAMIHETEEGKKVARQGGKKYHAVYERIPDADAPSVTVQNFFAVPMTD